MFIKVLQQLTFNHLKIQNHSFLFYFFAAAPLRPCQVLVNPLVTPTQFDTHFCVQQTANVEPLAITLK